ncbi:MAG TPA: MbnP family protein [Verrucomicrobiae bacterium]|nr:MbnP family protein [Verrucomicrobiae bacterium]
MTDKDRSSSAKGVARVRGRWLKAWLTQSVALGCLAWGLRVSGQELRLEIEPEWEGNPVVPGKILATGRVPGMSLSRVDGLLSRLALQRADGSWLKSDRWHVYFSAEKGRLTARADGLPAQEFHAIRFQVGLDAETDASDPEVWPADHPLHPSVCGLHWGWRSGYVFLALEGHWTPTKGETSGFSYHLAGAEKPMTVELPVRFSGTRPTTIRLGMDVSRILAVGDVVREASSTHSRGGDSLAAALKDRVTRSFAVKSVRADLYQPPDLVQPKAKLLPAGVTPVRLSVSERLPKVKLPEDNPLTVEGVELGRRLFNEPRLSRNNTQSCASCHDPTKAFTDGQSHSLGDGGRRGRRNAMSLANLAWANEFFWDGRAKSLREQVLLPIQDSHEMNETLDRAVTKLEADDQYPAQFKAAFGTAGITSNRVALALEQFLLTLISQDSKFDRAARKLAGLTLQEQRGLQLFVTEHDPVRGLRGADCFHCHGGNLFSNHQFMNNGLEERAGDLGRMEASGLEMDRAKFKVPTLRNVALTAPYMHDGRFATLEEVVEHYNGKLHRSRTLDPNLAKHPESGLGLSADDKAALVAFLKTLTDEAFVTSFSPVHQLSQTQ